MHKKRFVEWFVATSVEANALIAEYMSAHSLSEAETLNHDEFCADGKRRDVWRIRGEHVKVFRQLLRSHAHAKLRFFKRDAPESPLRQADFLLKPKKSAKAAHAKRELEEALQRKR